MAKIAHTCYETLHFQIYPSLAGDLRLFIDMHGNSSASLPYKTRKRFTKALRKAAKWIDEQELELIK
jgi:hypothetical protein